MLKSASKICLHSSLVTSEAKYSLLKNLCGRTRAFFIRVTNLCILPIKSPYERAHMNPYSNYKSDQSHCMSVEKLDQQTIVSRTVHSHS